MIAYLLAEMADWRRLRMRRTLCSSSALAAAIGLFGPLHPLALALATVLALIASAWAEALSPPGPLDRRADPETFAAGPLGIAAGRALAASASCLFILIALSPVLAASAIAWGIQGGAALECLFCWLSAYLLAASLHFLSRTAMGASGSLVVLCAYLLWLLSSFFSAPLMATNPFIQAWSALRLEGGGPFRSAMLAQIGISLAAFACSALVLALKRRKRNA